MKNTYKLSQLLIAYMLVGTLFLQGCRNTEEEKRVATSVREYIDPEKTLRQRGYEDEQTSTRTYEDESLISQAQSPIPSFPAVFTSANKLNYQILPRITVEVAQEVQGQTGLVIPFESGKTMTEFLGGKGAFGQLRLGKDEATGKYYGVKILQPDSRELGEARKEAQLQSKLNGLPHLMPIIDMGEAKGENNRTILYQVMPLASLGNGAQLADYLKTIKDPAFKEGLLIHVAKNILEGFAAMHGLSEPIVHLDFKPNNLVIDSKGEVYIIDFGCSKYLPADGKITGDANGDVNYFSPEREQITMDKYSTFDGKAADSWAIGATLLELAVGMIGDKEHVEEHPFVQQATPGSYAAMVKGFLDTNPTTRLTPQAALEKELFKQATKPVILVFLKEFVQNMQWNKKKEEMSQQTYKLTSAQQLPLPHFAGYANRPVLEQAVMDQLINGNSPVVACVGMGGVGKSQLLTYLVHQQVLQQRFKKIYWFQAADNETSLLIQYKGLAQELKLPGIDEKTPAEEAKTILIRWLERISLSTLLVFDNADDPTLLMTFLPKGRCQVLVSSRSPKWDNKIEVDMFTAEQVDQLLHKLLPDRNTALEEAKLLGEAMGYLPLAINQAIALIREEQKGIGEYLKVYEAKQKDLLETNRQLYGRALPKSMVTLYQIQLEKLQKECPEAITLLEYASLLASDNIPLVLFNHGLLNEGTPTWTYFKAQQSLFNYALWQMSNNEAVFRMHRLMQEVAKLSLQAELLQERFVKLAGCIVDEYVLQTTVLDEEARRKSLLPHLKTLEQVAKKQQLLTHTIQFAELLDCIGHCYHYQQGAYEKAVPLYEEALKIKIKHYGDDHPNTGMTLTNLGNAYGDLGNYEKAKELLEKDLKTTIKHYGEDDPRTSQTLVNLGNAYGNLGNYEKKKELLEKALKIKIKHYGEDHPETGLALGNLGNVYGDLGNYEKQQELLEKVLKIFIKHYGADHPQTALVLTNLGNTFYSLGDYEKSKEQLGKALKINTKHYGEDHPQTGLTLNSLGAAYGALGSYEKQQELLEKALKISVKHYGEDHPETGSTLANLGNAYGDLGNYEKKKEILEKALQIYIKHYGEDHQCTGQALMNLGNAYGNLGNHEKKKQLLEKTLKIKIKHYGENHLETGMALGNLGNVYGDLGNYKKEQELLEKVLKIFIKHYGADHPQTALVLTNLGNTFYSLGNYEKSKEQLGKALKINIKHYGEDHPQTGLTLNSLGAAYGALGSYEKQQELLEKALKIRVKHYGEDHPETGSTLANLGNAYGDLGNYEKEKEVLEKALQIYIKHYGEDHPRTGQTLMNLGNAHGNLGNYEKKKELLEKALKIKIKHYGEDHPETGLALGNLGNMYVRLQNQEKALRYYQQAYSIFIKHNHPHAARVKGLMDSLLTIHPTSQMAINKDLTTLGTAALCLGKYQKAKELLEQSLEVSINNNSVNHFEVGKTLVSLSQVYAGLGDYKKEQELLGQVLEISKKIYETDHPEVGATLMHMGISYFYLGAYEKVKETLEQAMVIKSKDGGADHPSTGMMLMYLGLAYNALDQPAKAFSCYQQAHAIFVKYPKLPQAGIIKTWMDRMG